MAVKQVAGAAAAAGAKKVGVLLSLKIALPVLALLLPLLGGGMAFFMVIATLTGGASGEYAYCDVEEDLNGTAITVTAEAPDGNAGETVTLNSTQLSNAAEAIAVGRQLGVSTPGLLIALMTGMVESKWWLYANDSVPESLDFDHDQVGSDEDSLNVFQQRPSMGWGSVKELMKVRYAAEAFFGGETGPNEGNPPGLLDIEGWEQLSLGDAAQEIQESKHPDRYAQWQGPAMEILELLDETITCSEEAPPSASPTGDDIAYPLNQPYVMTSGYGARNTGIVGASTWHAAVDLVNPGDACGQPVYAAMGGTVVASNGLWLSIQHPDGYVLSYLHMYPEDRLVKVDDQITAGQEIGAVGSVPPSSGCHLDFRIDVTENTDPRVATLKRAGEIGGPPESINNVNPQEFMTLMGLPLFLGDPIDPSNNKELTEKQR